MDERESEGSVMTAGPKVLVLGGARSGKSLFAFQKGAGIPGKKAFVATCPPLDSEMRERIKQHQRIRDSSWETVEEYFNLADCIKNVKESYQAILVDCATLWLSNWFLKEYPEARLRQEISKFVEAVRQTLIPVILVSNEVGMGIVPSVPLGRFFRDLQGYLNQELAGVADEVYLVVAGIPLKIK